MLERDRRWGGGSLERPTVPFFVLEDVSKTCSFRPGEILGFEHFRQSVGMCQKDWFLKHQPSVWFTRQAVDP